MTPTVTRLKVLSAGIFSLILVLGVARFAYTPLLPLMQQQAGLGVAEAGWLAAINYAGYLSGALIASRISSLVLKDRLYRIGMVLAIVSTLVMGLSTHIVAVGHLALCGGPDQRGGHAAGHRTHHELADPPQPPQRAGHPLCRHRPGDCRLCRRGDAVHPLAGLARAMVCLHRPGLPAAGAGAALAAPARHHGPHHQRPEAAGPAAEHRCICACSWRPTFAPALVMW